MKKLRILRNLLFLWRNRKLIAQMAEELDKGVDGKYVKINIPEEDFENLSVVSDLWNILNSKPKTNEESMKILKARYYDPFLNK